LPDDIRLKKVWHLDEPTPFAPQYKTAAEWEKRAKELREQLLVANGLWPMPEKPPLNAVIHGKIDRDDYTVEKVFFASLPGHYVCGNLYRPKRQGEKKSPGVLCPHGHWANGRFYENSEANAKKEIDSGAEKTMEGARYPLQARCAMLARMGCVVFHYDMVGYADSKQIPHRAGFADVEAELRLQSAMGLQTWNSVRALDFLLSLPDVDAQRIGVTGASGGGTQTFILAGIDPRVAVSFPAVMVSTEMQGGCICENCSLLRVGTNNIEMAALFAPKPQAMTGADDWTKRIESKGLPELKSIYGLYGAADRVHAKYASFPHNYNQVSREMMYNWFNNHLKLGWPETVMEKPFIPVPPKELSVFDAEHPLPKDAVDAIGVRKYMTEASEKQLARLRQLPGERSNLMEYRRVVGTALHALVGGSLPEKTAVVEGSFKAIKRDGFDVHQAVITRPGSGMQIPNIGIIPSGWNKTIVLWVHPNGKASCFEKDGVTPVPAVKQLLDRKIAVMAPDVYLTGEFHLPGEATKPPELPQKHHRDIPFAGYYLGYNRSVLANRVQDLLTIIAMTKLTGAERVHIAAFGKAGPWALLARGLSGDRIDRAAIDLNGFDFDQVKSVNDEMMLPGTLKYGGIYGFVPLCTSGESLLFGARQTGKFDSLERTERLKLHEKSASTLELVDGLLK
jgi:hypothetical protein